MCKLLQPTCDRRIGSAVQLGSRLSRDHGDCWGNRAACSGQIDTRSSNRVDNNSRMREQCSQSQTQAVGVSKQISREKGVGSIQSLPSRQRCDECTNSCGKILLQSMTDSLFLAALLTC